MPYGNRKREGKDVVKATGIGRELTNEALWHTDGTAAHGGIGTFITGPRGGGKTTLLCQLTQGCLHYPITVHDRAYTSKMFRETCAYRVRKYDYWNTFFPSYWVRAFPGWKPKPVIMHMHEDNDYQFKTDEAGRVRNLDMEECEIVPYTDTTELIVDNFRKNAINLICEPQDYMIPSDVVKAISLRKLQFKLNPNQQDDDPEEDPVNELIQNGFTAPPDDQLTSQQRKVTKKKKKYGPQPAPSPVWWYEFISRVLELKPQHDFLSIFLDEFQEIGPMYSRAEIFHLVGWLVNTTFDQRRMNVSMFAVSHDTTLIDYRIKKRMEYFIYMPGARPDGDNSLVWQSLTASLVKGEYVIEKPGQKYGIDEFDRFINQPPVVVCEGMQGYV
jgi:hypothetical protein